MKRIKHPHAPYLQSEIISKIYDAALAPEYWQRVLKSIRIHCGVDQCTLFYYNNIYKHQNIAAAAKTTSSAIALYLNKFIELQARQIQHQLALLPEGIVVKDSDIQELAGNNYSTIVGDSYMHSMLPNLQFQAGAVLKRSKLVCAGIGLQRFKNSPTITTHQVELLQSLIPHLIRAFDIHQAIMNKVNDFGALKCLFSQTKRGVILLNNNDEIEFINCAGKNVLAKSTHLKIGEDSRLQFSTSVQDSSDHIPKSRQLKRKLSNHSQSIFIKEHWGKLKVHVFQLQKKESSIQSANTKTKNSDSYMLLIEDPHRHCDIPFDYLQQAYHITPAEFDLINELVNGCTLNDAARQRDVTKETARWQLKSIMQKTHTHSQSELSRLLLAFCDN